MPASPKTLAGLARRLAPGPWAADAVCRLSDARELDPIIGKVPSEVEIQERRDAAQRLCARCPARASCGAAADVGRDTGVRAGALRYFDSSGQYLTVPLIPRPHPDR